MPTSRDRAHLGTMREARRQEAVRLRDTGLTLRESGVKVGVTGMTVSNDLRHVGYDRLKLDSVPPSHNGNNGNGHNLAEAARLLGLPSQGKGGQDWDALLTEALGVLRQRAEAGSVSAAATLAKLAIDQRQKQAVSCVDHVDESEVDAMIAGVVELYSNEFAGPFVRAAGARGIFGLDAHVVDALERVSEHMRRLGKEAEAEREAVPA